MRLAMLVLAAMTTVALAADAPPLRIYIPREIDAGGESLTLADVCIIRGEQSAAAAASAVAMGRSPAGDEKITFTRNAILSRLASIGVVADKVELTGAQSVVVSRKATVVTPEQLCAAAVAEADKMRPAPQGARWAPAARPDSIYVTQGDDFSLSAAMPEGPGEPARVKVSAVAAGKTLAQAEVTLKLQYSVCRAVASLDIAAGEKLTPQNVRVETIWAERPGEDFAPPFGQIASQRLAAGTVIRAALAAAPKAAVLVKRDDSVVMRVQGVCFTVTAVGQALEAGTAGQIIRVRNVDTKRIVTAKVMADGAVEPVMEGSATSATPALAAATTQPVAAATARKDNP